jgi:apolipoprotein N-acyltransferase
MIIKVAALSLVAYAVGLYWIFTSLHDFGGLPAWLAALSTLLLAAYVSLYAIGAAITIRWLQLPAAAAHTPWVAAAVITGFEWIRGWMFTGFPWLAIGYLTVDTPLAGYAPILGVYGIGFVAVLCLAWVFQVIRFRKASAFILLVVALVGGWALSTIAWTTPHERPLRIALVQGAIPQSMKFDPQNEINAIATHLRLARVAAVPGGAQLIVLPETALIRPWQNTPPEVQEAFRRITTNSGATLMLGVPLQDPDGYRNSLISLNDSLAESTLPGQFVARYDKHHLVPFGEFIPWGFRWFVDMMNMPLGDFQRGQKIQPPFLVADQRISANICFEDLFGEEIIRPLSPSIPADQHPTILLNVSNLAWFGDSIALSQHLAISRMRSMETGRPMIRATNTGATAIINHKGRVLEQLPFGQENLLVGQVQGMQGTTPYARFGNWLVLFMILAGLVVGIWRRPRPTPAPAKG